MTYLKPRSQCVSELETYKFLLRNGYRLKSISLIFCPEAKDSFCSHSEFALSSVQFSHSAVSDSVTPWTAARQTSLSITNSQSLPQLMSIEPVISSSHLILCHPLLLLPSIFPSIRVFSKESALCIRWPKYWSFSFNISPSNEHSALISFRMDWLDLLAVQGMLKSLLQHHSSKASILQLSAFFIVQLSHPYMTTGKTIALTRWTFVGKVMSLLFNMLSRLVIPFLSRRKRLLISWLQSPSAAILEPRLFIKGLSLPHNASCIAKIKEIIFGPSRSLVISLSTCSFLLLCHHQRPVFDPNYHEFLSILLHSWTVSPYIRHHQPRGHHRSRKPSPGPS